MVPLILICKSYDLFSFDRFTTMLKVYLELRVCFVGVEVDSREVCHHIDVTNDHYVQTIRDIHAPYHAVCLFNKKFLDAWLCSFYLNKYIDLKMQAELADVNCKKRHEEEIEKKIAEVRAAAAIADGEQNSDREKDEA